MRLQRVPTQLVPEPMRRTTELANALAEFELPDWAREPTAAEIAAGVTPVSHQYPAEPLYYLRRTGVIGDGVADDTAEIQAALGSGHKYIIGDPRHTYLVSHVSTFTVGVTAYRRCLSIPAGVTLDLNGATIKLADSQNSSPVALLADDAALINGVIDGNRTTQTTPATGDMACVIVHDVDRIRVENIRVKNVRQYAGRFLNVRNSHFVSLHCEDSYGDGWGIGTTVALELFDCFIDRIYAENCEGTYAGLEGNGIILTAIRTQVGTIHAKDCRGANKIQNTSADLTIASSIFDGDDQTYGSANSGTKIQGTNAASVWPTRVSIATVISKNTYGNGLLVRDIDTVQIGQYISTNSGSGSGATGSDQNDVEIALNNGTGSNHVQIGRIASDNPTARGARIQGNGNVDIDTVEVRNATNEGVQDTSSGRCNIRRILAIDDQGTPTMTWAYRATGTVKGRIGSIETNLTHSTTQSRISIATGNYDLEIGEIRLGSANVLGGIQQLTNAATSTAVTCGHIWRDFVGGTSDYLHPIIQVEPWDTSAKALSGTFGYTVTDGSSGTGFTITHPTAGAADYVMWKLLGWKVLSQASS